MSEVTLIKKTLALAVALTVVLGIFTVSTLLEPPAEATRIKGGLLRGPASIGSNTAYGPNTTYLSELNLPCHEAPLPRYEGYGNQLRIKGESCGKLSLFKTVSVLNHSNGVSATVFELPASQFTTDYMNLKQGDNEIHIVQILPNGTKRERSFIVSYQ